MTTSLPSQPPATSLLLSSLQASDRADHSTYLHSVRLTTIGHKFRSKLSIYKGSPESERPEILIVGDSIIRFLKLPGVTTYCLSGGKTADFIELIPALLDLIRLFILS